MFKCKSNRHAWTRQEDAEKCCNGYKRCLAVGKPPADAENIRKEAGTPIGFYWLKEIANDQP